MTNSSLEVSAEVKSVIFCQWSRNSLKLLIITNLIVAIFFFYTNPDYEQWTGVIYIGLTSLVVIPSFLRVYSVLFNWVTDNNYRNAGQPDRFRFFRIYSYIFCILVILCFELSFFALFLPLDDALQICLFSVSGIVGSVCLSLVIDVVKKLL